MENFSLSVRPFFGAADARPSFPSLNSVVGDNALTRTIVAISRAVCL